MIRSQFPQREVLDVPDPEVVLRIAELVASLPFASARALNRVRAVALPPDDGDPGVGLRGTWAWRELDWLPLYAHFGRTRGWLAARVRALSADELLALLERDLGLAEERRSGRPADDVTGKRSR